MGEAEGFFMPEIWLSLAAVCAEASRDVEGEKSTCEAVSEDSASPLWMIEDMAPLFSMFRDCMMESVSLCRIQFVRAGCLFYLFLL